MEQDYLEINEENVLDEESDEYFKAKEYNKGIRMVLWCTIPLVLVFLAGFFISLV